MNLQNGYIQNSGSSTYCDNPVSSDCIAKATAVQCSQKNSLRAVQEHLKRSPLDVDLSSTV